MISIRTLFSALSLVLSQARRSAAQGRRVARQTSSRSDGCRTVEALTCREVSRHAIFSPKVGHRPGGFGTVLVLDMQHVPSLFRARREVGLPLSKSQEVSGSGVSWKQ